MEPQKKGTQRRGLGGRNPSSKRPIRHGAGKGPRKGCHKGKAIATKECPTKTVADPQNRVREANTSVSSGKEINDQGRETSSRKDPRSLPAPKKSQRNIERKENIKRKVRTKNSDANAGLEGGD